MTELATTLTVLYTCCTVHMHSQGHLVRPGLGNELCKSIAAVNVNLSLIAYVDDTYGMCPEIIEENIYNAGYAAMIVYTSNRRISLDPATNINLPQAMFSDIVSQCSEICCFYSDSFYRSLKICLNVNLDRTSLIRMFNVCIVIVLCSVVLCC